MQGSGIRGSSQGRKRTDSIKVATRERWTEGKGRRSDMAKVSGSEVVHSRSQSLGFYNKLSSLYARPVGGAAMCQWANQGGHRRELHVSIVDFVKTLLCYPMQTHRSTCGMLARKWIHLCPLRMSSKRAFEDRGQPSLHNVSNSLPSFERTSLGLSSTSGL